MPFPKAIIFDVDGTLADNERDGHRVAFNCAFAEAGLDWVWSEHHYGKLLQVGGGKERLRHYIETEHPSLPLQAVRGNHSPERSAPSHPPPDSADLSREAPDGDAKGGTSDKDSAEDALDGFIRQLHTAKMKFYWQLLQKGSIPPRPGVLRLLQDCRAAEIRLAIATTSALPSAIALLETLAPEAIQWFEVIAAGDVVPRKKPAPDIYQYALQQLGLPASDCLAIEDSQPGCRAATAAGLTTLVTVNGYTRDEAFEGAALVLDHLGESALPCRILGGDRSSDSLAATLQSRPYVNLSLLRALAI